MMRSEANGDEADDEKEDADDEEKDEAVVADDIEDEDEEDTDGVVVSAVACGVEGGIVDEDDDTAEAADDGSSGSGGIDSWYRCSADRAASRQSALMSAPTKPCVLAAANSMSSSLQSRTVKQVKTRGEKKDRRLRNTDLTSVAHKNLRKVSQLQNSNAMLH